MRIEDRDDNSSLKVNPDGSINAVTAAAPGGATSAKQDSIILSLQASDEYTALLRRILKVLESNSVVDNKQRQKVVIEGVGTNNSPASTEVNATLPIAGTVTIGAVTSPASLGTSLASGGQGPTVGAPVLATTVYQPVWEGPVDQRWRVAESSHISYQSSIRSHLAFT